MNYKRRLRRWSIGGPLDHLMRSLAIVMGGVAGVHAVLGQATMACLWGIPAALTWATWWLVRHMLDDLTRRPAHDPDYLARWDSFIATLFAPHERALFVAPGRAAFGWFARHDPTRLLWLLGSDVLDGRGLAAAAESVGELESVGVVRAALAGVLRDDDPAVRCGAVWGLARHRSDPAVRDLLGVVRTNDPDAVVRGCAARALSWE